MSCRQNISLLCHHQNSRTFRVFIPAQIQRLHRKFHFLEFVESCLGMMQHHLFCKRFSVSCHPSHTCKVRVGLFWKNKAVLLFFICLTPKIKQSQNQEVASVPSPEEFPLDLSGTSKILHQHGRTFMSKLTRLSKEDLRKKLL